MSHSFELRSGRTAICDGDFSGIIEFGEDLPRLSDMAELLALWKEQLAMRALENQRPGIASGHASDAVVLRVLLGELEEPESLEAALESDLAESAGGGEVDGA